MSVPNIKMSNNKDDSKDRVGIIIQARMNSTRLPGKVMRLIRGKPMLALLIERLKKINLPNKIIIATTQSKNDDIIVKTSLDCGVDVFRGDENDVLSRYYLSAKKNNFNVIVRVNADCPFADPVLINDMVLEFLHQDNIDYLSNTIKRTFPVGFDVEVFSYSALGKAFHCADKEYQREHVTPYIRKNKTFLKFNYSHKPDLSNIRLTLDTYKDYKMITAIYESLYHEGGVISLKDILELLDSRSDILAINAQFKRNEGYEKSLSQDRIIQGD